MAMVKKKKLKDPPRFPKVINPLENEPKAEFQAQMKLMQVELVSNMVKYVKK